MAIELDLNKYDGIVLVSGDGLVHEVNNNFYGFYFLNLLEIQLSINIYFLHKCLTLSFFFFFINGKILIFTCIFL